MNSTDSERNNVEVDIGKNECVYFEFFVGTILIGSLCLLGIIGNSAAFIIFNRHKTETATLFLLKALAISDSFLLLASIIIYVLKPIYLWNGSLAGFHNNFEHVQRFVWPASMMCHTTTIMLTVLVTFNRYIAVCKPWQPLSNQHTNRCTYTEVLAVVVFAFLFNVPRYFEHHVIDRKISNDSNRTSTNINLGDNKIYQLVYSNILYFPVMYIVPLISLAYLNLKLIRTIKTLNEKRQVLTGHKMSNEDQITNVIIAVVFIFIICQTPALINQVLWLIFSQKDRECGRFHYYYTRISDVLVVTNSGVNFIIYCLFGKSFRRLFFQTVCPGRSYAAHKVQLRACGATEENEGLTVKSANGEPEGIALKSLLVENSKSAIVQELNTDHAQV